MIKVTHNQDFSWFPKGTIHSWQQQNLISERERKREDDMNQTRWYNKGMTQVATTFLNSFY